MNQPIRLGDKFKDADGIWTVISYEFGQVELQCLDGGDWHGALIQYPTKTVRTWERAVQLTGDSNGTR